MKTFFLTLLFPLSLFAGQVRIAVIDTGISNDIKVPLCETGHYDFSTKQDGIGYDDHGHGTNIVKAINSRATGDYCFIIIKTSRGKNIDGEEIGKAIFHATSFNANIINISISGFSPNLYEYRAIEHAEKNGIVIFVAAGNNSINLDRKCAIFPACYKGFKNLVVVGSKNVQTNKYMSFSNYGKPIKMKEIGCYEGWCGTSQSTAIAVGKFIDYIRRHSNDF